MTTTPVTSAPGTGGEHQIALAFEDGVTQFITCREDQTVADAAYRQRVNIPLDCRDGACGTCKALCESGEFDPGFYIDDALTDDEAERGFCLPCQMKPSSDLVLQIASTAAMAKVSAKTFTATIVELEHLSRTTVELVVEIADRSSLAFLPGQYVNIAVPGTDESRSYSFSSKPDEERLHFLVKLTPGGVMTTYLTERAAVGDTLELTGPNGSFFLREGDGPLLLLAGGTGLAPVLAIMRTLASNESKRPVQLVYGVSTDDDLVAVDQIEEAASALPDFRWDHCVSDPNSSAANKGYVTSLLTADDVRGDALGVYLCGPPPMVEAVRGHFRDIGVEPVGFYFEKFALAVKDETEVQEAELADEITGEIDDAVRARPAAGAGEPAGGAPSHDLGATATATATATASASAPPSLSITPDARRVTGQELFGASEIDALNAGGSRTTGESLRPASRAVTGQEVFASTEPDGRRALETGEHLLVGAATGVLGGQTLFPSNDLDPLTPPRQVDPTQTETAATGETAPQEAADVTTTADGYQIGEEHPDVLASDAVFDARRALELGALDLVLPRLDDTIISGWRLLAEATASHVEGNTFLDAAAYTEANAAFHDYLFTQTGSPHLLDAYTALGVKARMNDVLRDAQWCHPDCVPDHLAIVDALEARDRDTARDLIVTHAEHSKETIRRAMTRREARPRFVTPGRFTGKVVVVTGAGQGIGEAVARRVHAEDGLVVAVDRSPHAQELATELTALEWGGRAVGVQADLETFTGATQMVEAAVAEFGRVDVLVNNVGGAINFKPFTQFTDAEIEAEISRSLMTTLWSCRAALPGMLTRGSGVIVNVSSVATRGIHRIPYSAAKGGINALTASLAMECAESGVRVVATAPGGTQAPARKVSRGGKPPQNEQEQAWFDAHVDQTLSSSLLNRYGTLEEQAAAITFLASEEASYITGTVLPVGGGDLG